MLRKTRTILYPSAILFSTFMSNISYSSELVSEDTIEKKKITSPQKQTQNTYIASFIWPTSWFSNFTEEKEENIIDEIANWNMGSSVGNDDQLEELLSDAYLG